VKPTPDITVAADLAGRIRLGLAVIDGATVHASDPALAAEIASTAEDLRRRHAGAASGDVPGVEDARALYKALGIDPTKTRPSNEALLRRLLKGEALYTVNTLVDALNVSSVREQVPFGLYDLDRVEPPVVLRRGGPGESYEGIRKGPVNVDGRPVLCDARGPFGNPTSDSARTMITLDTRSVLVIAYAPATCTPSRLQGVLERTAATLVRFSGGSIGEVRVVA
jgi:DNA/RNA-binding domain of Phe-tRNA-synthetase-like protein